MGRAQTRVRALWGYGLHKVFERIAEWFWESHPERVKAPYTKAIGSSRIQSTTRHEKPCGKSEGPPSKAKYSLVTDSA